MKISKSILSVLLCGLLHIDMNEAFSTTPALSRQYNYRRFLAQVATPTDTLDCGCETIDTVYTGNPSNDARNNIKHKEVIADLSLFKLDGGSTTIDEILGTSSNNSDDEISLVVFLRSFG